MPARTAADLTRASGAGAGAGAAPTAEPVEVCVAGQPVVRLTPLAGRARVGLAVPGLDRVVDVSVQPTAACRALDDAGRRARVPSEAVEADARRAVREAARRCGGWTPAAQVDLAGAFVGVAFPVLGAAVDVGAPPVREVPRWAEAVLSAGTVGEAATIAFGAGATRPVRRALVETLRPQPSAAEVGLGVLALALVGRDLLEPDRLARLLGAERAEHPPADWPDPSTLRRARRAVDGWGSVRAERVLLEAAARPDGLRRLFDTVEYALHLGDHGPPHPLPNRLDELHDVHRVLLRSAADRAPGAGAGPTARPGVPPCDRARAAPALTPAAMPAAMPELAGMPEPARPRRQAPHPLLAPDWSHLPRVAAGTPVVAPRAFAALDGLLVGDLTLRLPRTVGDLTHWSRVLDNCLADFGPSVAAGRSVIVAVERDRQLRYALELTPQGRVRQFTARANRRPRDRDRIAVLTALLGAGALDPHATQNRDWLAGVDRVRPERDPA